MQATTQKCLHQRAPAHMPVKAPPGRTVGMFWDLDNIPVLAPGSAVAIQIHRLKAAVSMSGECITTFKAYGNKQSLSSLRKAGTLRRMEACGVEVVEAQTFPESADTLLRSDAYFWGRAARDLGCIAIISGDTGFAPTLRHLTSLGVYTISIAEHLPNRKYGKLLPPQAVLPKLLLPAAARAAVVWSRKQAQVTKDELAAFHAITAIIRMHPGTNNNLHGLSITDPESSNCDDPSTPKAYPSLHPGFVSSDWTNPVFA